MEDTFQHFLLTDSEDEDSDAAEQPEKEHESGGERESGEEQESGEERESGGERESGEEHDAHIESKYFCWIHRLSFQ